MAAWTRDEVEAIVDDYFQMLRLSSKAVPFNKTERRQALLLRLSGRSNGSVEYKHQNISAVLLDAGAPYVDGYKPRSNYQRLLAEVVGDRLRSDRKLIEALRTEVEREAPAPTFVDPLTMLTPAPTMTAKDRRPPPAAAYVRVATDILQREANNRSLGAAGEVLVLNFERERLIREGRDDLSRQVEHVSRTIGDGLGYDVRSFDRGGKERFIEVKTTNYGDRTPFFVSRNEVATSAQLAERYHLYRVYTYRSNPRLFTLAGNLERSCRLDATSFLAPPGVVQTA